MNTPETFYVKTSDGVYIAYQAVGEGPVDIVMEFNTDEGNVDLMWTNPTGCPSWRGPSNLVGSSCTTGARPAFRAGTCHRRTSKPRSPTCSLFSTQLARTVLSSPAEPTAARSRHCSQPPIPIAPQEFAWNNPAARNAWAPDYPWGRGRDEYERSVRYAEAWGTAAYGRAIADWREAERRGVTREALGDVEHARERLNRYARIVRNTATPDVALEINRIFWETDVRGVLPSVTCPVALITGEDDGTAEVEYLASLLPQATVHVLAGRSGMAVKPILEITRNLAGVIPRPTGLDTVLSTVLFTDIVDSTARQAALGDARWKTLVQEHHALVREALSRWRGSENDTAGDGFYATFEGPARAIRCALEIVQRASDLGVAVRAGVHTGECEIIDGKPAGLTVSIGARVASTAGPSEVRVSQTVKDLVAGSGFTFADAGMHELKGVPDQWRLYQVTG